MIFKLFLLYSKIAKLEEELRLVNNALKTLELNEEKVILIHYLYQNR